MHGLLWCERDKSNAHLVELYEFLSGSEILPSLPVETNLGGQFFDVSMHQFNPRNSALGS